MSALDDVEVDPSSHELIITLGDEEFYGRCSCGVKRPAPTTPNQSFDIFAMWWERHVMLAQP